MIRGTRNVDAKGSFRVRPRRKPENDEKHAKRRRVVFAAFFFGVGRLSVFFVVFGFSARTDAEGFERRAGWVFRMCASRERAACTNLDVGHGYAAVLQFLDGHERLRELLVLWRSGQA